MRLPGGDRALVEPEKVRDYLLSASHPIGRFKATFFRSLGYTESEGERLIADICTLAATGDAVPGQATAYGQKYEVRGTLSGPTGEKAVLVTVWIVLVGDDVPRLVTAYPGVDA